MEKSKTICILLTGTINPLSVPDLVRYEHKVRENDYYTSILKWLKLDFPIVFVENSNYDSTLLNELALNYENFEYLKFKTSTSQKGKSHGEAEIIIYAMKNSSSIENSDYVVKITGRYYVKNILNLVDNFVEESSIDAIVWLKNYSVYSDSRFFLGTKDFYNNYLIPMLEIINEEKKVYFEHALARATHRLISDGYTWKLPCQVPIFEGFSGTMNIEYKNDIFRLMKRNIVFKLMKLSVSI